MAILKKGSRQIAVDGCFFRWRVRHRPTYHQGLCWSNYVLAVEAAEGSGSKLVVLLPHPHTSNWMQQSAQSVLPSQVTNYILQAVAEGWQPNQSGKPFTLTIGNQNSSTAG